MKQDLSKIVELINLLTNTSSTKEKENILRENSNEPLLKDILMYVYDKDKKFGIQKKSLSIRGSGGSKWDDLFDMLDELSESNINKDLKIEVGKFLGDIEDETERDLVVKILLKDLRIGMKEKSANKAIPGLIVTHDIMKASKWEGDIKEEVGVSLKLDGVRVSFVITEGKAIAKTRQGKVINGMNTLIREIEALVGKRSMMLDGELLAINRDGLDSKNLFKKTSAIVNSKGVKEGLTLVAFDCVPLEDYINKSSEIPFIERRKYLEELIGDTYYIKVAPLYFYTKDVDEIKNKLDEVVSQGLEGLILNKVNGVYKFGRSKDILKVKKFSTADVLVVDMEEGEGKLVGMLGKIVVQFKYKDKIHTSKIGSGFSEEERMKYWKNKELLLGKVVEISYFELTTNEKDENAINFRFGTWIDSDHIRFDKNGLEDTNVG